MALLAAASLLSGPVSAQEIEAEAAVITIPSTDASPEEATAALAPIAGRLQRRSGRRVVLPQVAVTRIAAGEGQGRLDAARAEAARARESMRAFDDLDGAASLLEDAAAQYLELLPMLDGVDEPLSLLRDLATVRLAQDDERGVEAALAEAARLDPDLEMDRHEDPRRLREAASRVRDSLGDDVPVLAPEVAARYAALLGVVRIGVARIETSGRIRVDVYHRSRGERTTRLDLDPEDLEGSTRDLGRALGISLDREREADAREPERRDDRRSAEPEAVEPDVEVARETPWYHTWWFWTTVGVVVAGAIVFTAIVASDLSD